MAMPNFFIFNLDGYIRSTHASLLRITVYGYMLIFFFSRQYLLEFSLLPGEFWWPTGLAHLFDFLAPPLQYFNELFYFWLMAICLSLVGLFSRLSKALVFLGYLLLGSYDQHFGFVSFLEIPLTFLLFYCIFIKDQAWSLDRALFKRMSISENVEIWPLLCFQIFFVFLYVGSAYQKLASSGWQWIFGRGLEAFVAPFFIEPTLSWVLVLVSVFALILELTSPLIFVKKLTLIYLAAFVSFHLLSIRIFQVSNSIWILCLLTFLLTRSATYPRKVT